MSLLYDLYRRVGLKIYGAYDGSVDIVAMHEHRVLYFAVPKVANTSIKVVLAHVIDAERQRRAEAADGKSSFLRDPRQRLGLYRDHTLLHKFQVARYRGYRKVAFVRNPFDRLVSCYADKVMRDTVHAGVAESVSRYTDYTNEMPFREFADAVCRMGEREANRHFRSQYTFLVDRRGRLMPDTIGRFETLAEDFSRIFEECGVASARLPVFKATKHEHYRSYYDDETREAVARRYARDLELFGYEF